MKKVFKKKYVILISVIAIIIILGSIVGWTLLDQGESVEIQIEPTESIEQIEQPEQVDTTEDEFCESIPPEMYEEVNGIPRVNFESTKGREFDFYLMNSRTGQRWEINGDELFGSIDYDFADLSSHEIINEEFGMSFGYMAEPRRVSPVVELLEEDYGSRFIFGVLNENTEVADAHDCPIIYVEYCGIDEWVLCGISTGMKYDEIVELLGEPSQEMGVSDGYAMDYLVMGDEHTYNIHVVLDSKDGGVTSVVLSIDNYPIHSNQTLDEMGRG